MDTLIFASLLATAAMMFQQRSRRVVLGGWWIAFALTCLLLRHNITGGLGLGLSW